MRRGVFLLASVLVSGFFLWLTLRDVPLAPIIDSIREARAHWLLVALASVTLGLWTRAVRWRGMLDDRISLLRAFHIVNITFLLNQLPLRAGEVARSLLATQSGVPLVTAATSIVVERILDTLVVVVLLAVALNRIADAPAIATQAALLFGIAALLAFGVLLFFARRPQIAYASLDFFERRVTLFARLPVRRLLENVLDGLQPLTTAYRFAHTVGWTLISWTFSLLTVYALERSLSIAGIDLILNAVLGVTLASFSIAIPVTVAAIGPFEGAVRVAGEALGLSPTLATTLGFLLHGVSVLGYAIWGIIGFASEGVSLSATLQPQESAGGD